VADGRGELWLGGFKSYHVQLEQMVNSDEYEISAWSLVGISTKVSWYDSNTWCELEMCTGCYRKYMLLSNFWSRLRRWDFP
jgi:hypothetical protein